MGMPTQPWGGGMGGGGTVEKPPWYRAVPYTRAFSADLWRFSTAVTTKEVEPQKVGLSGWVREKFFSVYCSRNGGSPDLRDINGLLDTMGWEEPIKVGLIKRGLMKMLGTSDLAFLLRVSYRCIVGGAHVTTVHVLPLLFF